MTIQNRIKDLMWEIARQERYIEDQKEILKALEEDLIFWTNELTGEPTDVENQRRTTSQT